LHNQIIWRNIAIMKHIMNVIYMEDTIGLMGEEKVSELIPKGIIKKTENNIKYLVINEENL